MRALPEAPGGACLASALRTSVQEALQEATRVLAPASKRGGGWVGCTRAVLGFGYTALCPSTSVAKGPPVPTSTQSTPTAGAVVSVYP